MEDKRRFERFLAPVNVTYWRDKKGEERKEEASCKDLSRGGIRLSLPEALAPGTSVKLEIGIPEATRVVPASGRVIWLRQVRIIGEQAMNYFDTGIEFTDVSPVSLGLIYRYFSERMAVI